MSVSMTTMCSQELDGNENGAVTETGKRSDALNENGVSHGDAACDTAMIESDAADEEAKDTSEYEFRRMMKIQDNMRILRSLGLLEKLIPAPPSTPTQPKGNKKLKATSRVGHVSADQAARAQSGRKHRKPVRFIPGTPRRYFAVGTRVLALRAEIERPAPVLADNESHVTSQTQFLDDAQLRCWKITGSMHIGKLIGKSFGGVSGGLRYLGQVVAWMPRNKGCTLTRFKSSLSGNCDYDKGEIDDLDRSIDWYKVIFHDNDTHLFQLSEILACSHPDVVTSRLQSVHGLQLKQYVKAWHVHYDRVISRDTIHKIDSSGQSSPRANDPGGKTDEWLAATVREVKPDGLYSVAWDECWTTMSIKSADEMRALQEWSLGTPVRMLRENGAWCKGAVLRFDVHSGLYTIQFDGGNTLATHIPSKWIEVMTQPPTVLEGRKGDPTYKFSTCSVVNQVQCDIQDTIQDLRRIGEKQKVRQGARLCFRWAAREWYLGTVRTPTSSAGWWNVKWDDKTVNQVLLASSNKTAWFLLRNASDEKSVAALMKALDKEVNKARRLSQAAGAVDVVGKCDSDKKFAGNPAVSGSQRCLSLSVQRLCVQTGKVVAEWQSLRAAARDTGLTLSSLQRAASKGRAFRGSLWRYVACAPRGRRSLCGKRRAACDNNQDQKDHRSKKLKTQPPTCESMLCQNTAKRTVGEGGKEASTRGDRNRASRIRRDGASAAAAAAISELAHAHSCLSHVPLQMKVSTRDIAAHAARAAAEFSSRQTLKLQVGAKVEALHKRAGWHRAQIQKKLPGSVFLIAWEDGDTTDRLKTLSAIRSRTLTQQDLLRGDVHRYLNTNLIDRWL